MLSLQQIEAGELSLPVQYSRYTILYIEEGRGSFQASYRLGDPNHGFPLLSARGRLVIKDVIMMAAAFSALCDSARQYLILKGRE